MSELLRINQKQKFRARHVQHVARRALATYAIHSSVTKIIRESSVQSMGASSPELNDGMPTPAA